MMHKPIRQRLAGRSLGWSSRGSRVAGALFVAIACLSLACGGGPASPSGSGGSGSGNSGGSGSGAGSGTGTIRAFIDGVAYTGTVNAASFRNGTLNIASNDAALSNSINLALSNVYVGVFQVNATTPLTMQVMTLNGTNVTGSWSASVTGGSGTILVNTLSTVAATGTFSFVGVPSSSGGVSTPAVNRSVTNGSFSVFF